LQLETSLIIYSCADAKILSSLDLQSNGFEISSDRESLYIITNQLIEYNLKNNAERILFKSKNQLQCIKLHSKKNQIAVSDTKIYLIDLKGRLLRTFSGHATPVLDLGFSGSFWFSCAQDDRYINRWSKDGKSKGSIHLRSAGFRFTAYET
jgi:WD40 repeat protein